MNHTCLSQGEGAQHGLEALPARTIAAIAPRQPFAPQLRHLPPQLVELAIIAGDSVVGIVPAQLLVEFALLLLQRQVTVFPSPFFDCPQRPSLPPSGSFLLHHLIAAARFSPVMGEAKEVECLRLSSSARASSRWSPKAHHSRFLRIDLQSKSGKAFGNHPLDFLRVLQPLRAHDEVSSAGEFHPHALAEPDVSLSAHPAPTVEAMPLTPIRQCANSSGSRREMRLIQCVALRRCRVSFLYFRHAHFESERSSCLNTG